MIAAVRAYVAGWRQSLTILPADNDDVGLPPGTRAKLLDEHPERLVDKADATVRAANGGRR